jgi:hypothetical protein
MAYKADGQVKKAVELFEHVVAVEADSLRDDRRQRMRLQPYTQLQ